MRGDAGVTLDAVQSAALEASSAEAEAVRRAARVRAMGIIASARAEAAEVIAGRRAAAQRLADLEEQELLGEARAQARATVLRAERSVLTAATAAARTEARRLAGDRRFELLLERLAAEARERLGPSEGVEIVPAPGGGFIARTGSRQIDYSLDALLHRCLEQMSPELERLWR